MLHVEHDKSGINLTPSAKQRIREKLQNEIEEFIKQGNAIIEVPPQKSKPYVAPFDEIF
ncbi:MAG TPA: hypothetical protein VIZ65_16215 [Cellvibrionaceae bacterium]